MQDAMIGKCVLWRKAHILLTLSRIGVPPEYLCRCYNRRIIHTLPVISACYVRPSCRVPCTVRSRSRRLASPSCPLLVRSMLTLCNVVGTTVMVAAFWQGPCVGDSGLSLPHLRGVFTQLSPPSASLSWYLIRGPSAAKRDNSAHRANLH